MSRQALDVLTRVKPSVSAVVALAGYLRATNIPGELNDGVKIRESHFSMLDFRLPIETGSRVNVPEFRNPCTWTHT